MYSPVLLIGLGGLGSHIVTKVYENVPEEKRGCVQAHILDTDTQTLGDKKFRWMLDHGKVTQISTPETVGECLQRLGERTAVNAWFPPGSMGMSALKYKQMTIGASQVRLLSRLALLNTIDSGRIDKLERTMSSLQRARGEELTSAIRVMIVTSIAGGTGSGAFLQLALYIRDYFTNHLQARNVIIRGMVAMPEIFVKNGDYTGQDFIQNVRANGYAALKEIDALTRLRAGQLSGDTLPQSPIILEHKAGVCDSAEVTEGEPPLDFVFLYDFQNSNGENIGGKDNYIQQMVDAIYLQLFSPLDGQDGIYSQEDNLIRTLVASNDRARYAGSAVSRLIYPYATIIDYCALQWAAGVLSRNWLEIDNLIEDELRQNERDRQQGNDVAQPVAFTRFVELLDQKVNTRNPEAFFLQMHAQTHLQDPDGSTMVKKSVEWIAAMNTRIASALAEANSEPRAPVADYLRDSAQVQSQVEQLEAGLRRYEKELRQRIRPLANMIVKEAVWGPYERQVDVDSNNDLQLNTWLLKKNEAMHPVAIRYMLGEVWRALRDQVARLDAELSNIEVDIGNYSKRWDDQDTELQETAADHAGELAGKGLWDRLRSPNGLNNFAEEYEGLYSGQCQRLFKRAKKQVERDVKRLILGHVEDMLEDWKRFFQAVIDSKLTCERNASKLGRMHDENNDPTRIYVMASSEQKAWLWDEHGTQMRGRDLPPEMARSIYLALYRQRAAKHFDEPVGTTFDWAKTMIETEVLGWCRNELREIPALNMNIKEALCTQWRLSPDQEQNDEESYISIKVQKLKALAHPFVPNVADAVAFEFWCMHTDVETALSAGLLARNMPNHRSDTAFAANELLFLRMSYGLRASDFPAMTDPAGVYRQAYNGLISESRQVSPSAITPHLDWRWDSPAFLPEIDDASQHQAIRNIHRAVLHNMAMKEPFYLSDYDQETIWMRSLPEGVRQALSGPDGKTVVGDISGLYSGLSTNYVFVTELMQRAEAEIKQCNGRAEETVIAKQAKGILIRLLEERRKTERVENRNTFFDRMITTLFDEICAICKTCIGTPNAAHTLAEQLLTSVVEPDGTATPSDLVKRLLNDALTKMND